MRKPEYLSFSSYSQWTKDKQEFYLRYLAEHRPPRLPQAPPAAVGSGFDAHVKANLHSALFGKGSDPEYELDKLYETQVEPQNRDFARLPSLYAFHCYVQSGLYRTLLDDLQQADGAPRFESKVQGFAGIAPILGKPDLYWRRANGLRVIHDWKVNGYCSKANTSPNKCYRISYDSWKCGKPSQSHGKPHKSYTPLDFQGYDIDTAYMEDYNIAWASQLSMYAWCLGETPASEEFVVQIHQITGKGRDNQQPLLRNTEFRARVRKSFQEFLCNDLQECWKDIDSGYIFTELDREDSDAKCESLDRMSETLKDDDYFSTLIRPEFKGY